jgi:Mn2+/Fe2+ NRAMP family transporter
VLGALIVLLPIKSLIQAMIFSQTLNGVLLPVILVFILLLINDRRIMGKHVNSPAFNVLAWLTVVILTILALILIVTTFFPSLVK